MNDIKLESKIEVVLEISSNAVRELFLMLKVLLDLELLPGRKVISGHKL